MSSRRGAAGGGPDGKPASRVIGLALGLLQVEPLPALRLAVMAEAVSLLGEERGDVNNSCMGMMVTRPGLAAHCAAASQLQHAQEQWLRFPARPECCWAAVGSPPPPPPPHCLGITQAPCRHVWWRTPRRRAHTPTPQPWWCPSAPPPAPASTPWHWGCLSAARLRQEGGQQRGRGRGRRGRQQRGKQQRVWVARVRLQVRRRVRTRGCGTWPSWGCSCWPVSRPRCTGGWLGGGMPEMGGWVGG